jgi:outer membrane immunogenic protein
LVIKTGVIMKRLLASALLGSLIAGPAIAADLGRPIYKAPPPPPVYNWTGCYLGAGGGYGFYNKDRQIISNGLFEGAGPTIEIVIPAPAGTVLGGNETFGGRGWLFTAQGGCDYQFAGPFGGNWVIGAFIDGDWSNMRGDESVFVSNWIGQEKLSSSWAVGGRIGWLVNPTLLTYVSAGYTQARFDEVNYVLGPATRLSQLGLVSLGTLPGATLTAAAQTYDGFFIGGGAEYQLGWFPGLFWKTEYRYADYRSASVPLVCTSCVRIAVGAFPSERIHPTVQTVRSELVWRFNWAGPVYAKY